jgi:hypothetical protein
VLPARGLRALAKQHNLNSKNAMVGMRLTGTCALAKPLTGEFGKAMGNRRLIGERLIAGSTDQLAHLIDRNTVALSYSCSFLSSNSHGFAAMH